MKTRLLTYFLTIFTISIITTKDWHFYNKHTNINLQAPHITNVDNAFSPPGYFPNPDASDLLNSRSSNLNGDVVAEARLNGRTQTTSLDSDKAVPKLHSESDISKLFVYKNQPRKVTAVENDSFTTKSIAVIENNPQLFLKNMFEVLTKDLKNADIIKEINSNHNFLRKNMPWYVINPKASFKYKYIKIPISLVPLSALTSSKASRNDDTIYLIFDTNTFHLQGYQKLKLYIVPTYYYFADATITSIKQNQKFSESIKLEINTNYEKIIYDNDILTWKKIYDSFNKLFTTEITPLTKIINKKDIENIMLVTLEALKFRDFQKLFDYNSGVNTNILNDWKKFFLDRINVWGESSEIKRMIKNLEERGNINSLVLSNYDELILPPNISKYLYKIGDTNNYELKLLVKTLYYDPITMENKIATFTSKNGNEKKDFVFYDMNLKKINPLVFNDFNFIGVTRGRPKIINYRFEESDDHSGFVQWGSVVINTTEIIDRINAFYDLHANNEDKSEPNQPHRINRLIESKLYEANNSGFVNKRITVDSSWEEANSVAPITKQFVINDKIGVDYNGRLPRKDIEIEVVTKVGLTWYYDDEKDEYHLQLIITFRGWTKCIGFGIKCFFTDITSEFKIGKGIRLYENYFQ